jgi:PIN domain nuclease of toxin-antitoxin system
VDPRPQPERAEDAFLLLDTHIWSWYLTGSRRLPGRIKEILDRPDELPWLSPVSIWETAILAAKKRIEITTDFRTGEMR